MILENVLVICFAVCLGVVLSSPTRPNVHPLPFPTDAIIDCRDRVLLKRIVIAKISYRCLEGTDSLMRHRTSDFRFLMNKIEGELESPLQEVLILESSNCRYPERCETKLTISDYKMCPENFVFFAAVGECIPSSANGEEVYQDPELRGEEVYQDPELRNLLRRDCREGFSYESELNRCVAVQVFLLQNYKPIQSDKSHECPLGYIYNPEVDTCLYLEPTNVQQGPTIADSLILGGSKPSAKDSYETTGNKRCPKGWVYASEIDTCMVFEKPLVEKDNSQNGSPLKMAQIKTNTSSENPLEGSGFNVTLEKVGRSKCKQGQIYVSELEICVDNES